MGIVSLILLFHVFERMTNGRNKNSYYHESFVQGMPHLCKTMKPRSSQKSSSTESGCSEKETDYAEPDFFTIAKEHPLPSIKVEDNEDMKQLASLNNFILKHGPKAKILSGDDLANCTTKECASSLHKVEEQSSYTTSSSASSRVTSPERLAETSELKPSAQDIGRVNDISEGSQVPLNTSQPESTSQDVLPALSFFGSNGISSYTLGNLLLNSGSFNTPQYSATSQMQMANTPRHHSLPPNVAHVNRNYPNTNCFPAPTQQAQTAFPMQQMLVSTMRVASQQNAYLPIQMPKPMNPNAHLAQNLIVNSYLENSRNTSGTSRPSFASSMLAHQSALQLQQQQQQCCSQGGAVQNLSQQPMSVERMNELILCALNTGAKLGAEEYLKKKYDANQQRREFL